MIPEVRPELVYQCIRLHQKFTKQKGKLIQQYYLEVGPDDVLAFVTPVGEQLFVTLDAELLVVAQNVPVSGQV